MRGKPTCSQDHDVVLWRNLVHVCKVLSCEEEGFVGFIVGVYPLGAWTGSGGGERALEWGCIASWLVPLYAWHLHNPSRLECAGPEDFIIRETAIICANCTEC
jgi:hypothetical protein